MKATYKALMIAFLKADEAKYACNVSDLFKDPGARVNSKSHEQLLIRGK